MTINWTPGQTLEDVEKIVIQKAYIYFSKNKSATARGLGISLRTLDNKFEKYEEDDRKNKQDDERREKERREWNDRARGISPSHGHKEEKDCATTRNGVESSQESSTEPTMPMQKSEEVQAVLPSQTTDLRPKRASGKL